MKQWNRRNRWERNRRNDDIAPWINAFENFIIIGLTLFLIWLNILNLQANRRNADLTAKLLSEIRDDLDVEVLHTEYLKKIYETLSQEDKQKS